MAVSPAPDEMMERVSEETFAQVWQPPKGLWGWLTTVQNQAVGIRFIATSFGFFIAAGVLALLMRLQLIRPENTFLSPETYNRFFTMHGSTMMFLFLIPLVEGIATLVLPQMFGSRELPFPRFSAFSYWTFLFGGLIFYSSFLFGAVPDAGWFAYVPLTGEQFSPGKGMDFWLLGLNVAEVGAIAGAVEIIMAFFKMRAPGMSLVRTPIFAWAMMITAFMMLFAFTPLIVGSLMLEIDRKFGTHFYDPTAGGSPLLWQHIFWIFGHPDVYIQFIPAVGMVSTIVPVFSRRRLVGHNLVILSLIATGFLSFGLWVHHMFATGLPEVSLSFFSAASFLIAIPSGIQIFAWIATIWLGKPVWRTPFLFIIGFIVTFVMGGLTGVMIGAAPFDLQVHDTFFLVAHFHYVLIGGVVFPVFAGIYYWMPKFLNRMPNERLGQWNFWLMFIGFHVTFFPMHIAGMLGMPRRVYTYQAGLGLDAYNLISTIGSFMIALSVLVFVINYLWTLRNGKPAPANPWNADTLEWAPETPVPQYGFRTLPIVRSRTPLWDQEGLHRGDPQTETLIANMAQYPTRYRSQLVTTALDAEPTEIFRIAGPSIWPFVLAATMMLFTFFLIFDLTLLAGISAVLSAAALIAWHTDTSGEKRTPTDARLEQEFERRTGIPVRPEGSRAVARWGMLLAILALGIVLATLVFSYLYLRLDVPTWPPFGLEQPDLLLPILASITVFGGAIAQFFAARGYRREQGAGLRIGLAVAAVASVIYTVLQVAHLSQLNFTPQTHAYGSIFYGLALVQTLFVLGGLLLSGVTLFWTIAGEREARAHPGTTEIALYWYFLAGAQVVVFATLYLLPMVL